MGAVCMRSAAELANCDDSEPTHRQITHECRREQRRTDQCFPTLSPTMEILSLLIPFVKPSSASYQQPTLSRPWDSWFPLRNSETQGWISPKLETPANPVTCRVVFIN